MSDSDDRLRRLIAIRDQLSNALESCESTRDLPGLARELRMVLAEIGGLHTKDTTDVVDEIAARRKAAPARRAARSS
jgi:hypothetical protein